MGLSLISKAIVLFHLEEGMVGVLLYGLSDEECLDLAVPFLKLQICFNRNTD